jgi:flagellar hook-length control protein FliK
MNSLSVDSQSSVESVNNQTPQSSTQAPDLANGQTFLSLLFPETIAPLPTNLKGPEPPGKANPSVEEAATSPNATLQKLDSPQKERKTKATDLVAVDPSNLNPALVGLISTPLTPKDSAFVNSSATAQPSFESKGLVGKSIGVASESPNEEPADLSPSQQGVAQDEEQHLQTQFHDLSPSALPIDPNVPIVSVKTFSVLDNKLPGKQDSVENADQLKSLHSTVTDATTEAKAPFSGSSSSITSADASILSSAKPAESAWIQPKVEMKVNTQDLGSTSLISSHSSNARLGTDSHARNVAGEHFDKDSGIHFSAVQPGSQGSTSQGSGSQNGQGKDQFGKSPDLAELQAKDKTAKVAEVVAKFETMMAARPKNGITVELAPKDLGRISFTLKRFGQAVDTQFSASNDGVRTALSESRPDLSHSMSAHGYVVTGMTVDGHTLSFSSQSHSQQEQSNARKGQVIQDVKSSKDLSLHSKQLSQPSWRTPAAGVDLWI